MLPAGNRTHQSIGRNFLIACSLAQGKHVAMGCGASANVRAASTYGTAVKDTTGDGKYDTVYQDTTGDGKYDTAVS